MYGLVWLGSKNFFLYLLINKDPCKKKQKLFAMPLQRLRNSSRLHAVWQHSHCLMLYCIAFSQKFAMVRDEGNIRDVTYGCQFSWKPQSIAFGNLTLNYLNIQPSHSFVHHSLIDEFRFIEFFSYIHKIYFKNLAIL